MIRPIGRYRSISLLSPASSCWSCRRGAPYASSAFFAPPPPPAAGIATAAAPVTPPPVARFSFGALDAPVRRLNPQFAHVSAPTARSLWHDGQRKPTDSSCCIRADAFSPSARSYSASFISDSGAGAGAVLDTIIPCEPLHSTLRPASSGFNLYCLPHASHANLPWLLTCSIARPHTHRSSTFVSPPNTRIVRNNPTRDSNCYNTLLAVSLNPGTSHITRFPVRGWSNERETARSMRPPASPFIASP